MEDRKDEELDTRSFRDSLLAWQNSDGVRVDDTKVDPNVDAPKAGPTPTDGEKAPKAK